jgi:CheY-like chemotaxis protein/HPt (histidine-containing phosphotransfer) domain-containing protein
MKILLVDDSEDNLLLLRTYLRKTAHEVAIAVNGASALEQLKAGSFDLVFMDMQMPVMDGYEAVPAFRKWENEQKRKPIPIIALTAYDQDEEREKTRAIGCTMHLSKPVSQAAIMNCLKEHISEPAEIRICISDELIELIPGYLNNRKTELPNLEAALIQKDFSVLQRIGHNLRGSGESYGLKAVSDIGQRLEEAAKQLDLSSCRSRVEDLKTFYAQVKVFSSESEA